MVKVDVFELPPPGAGLVTVTAGVPVEAMLAAGMAAVNCVELTKVVAGADPPKLTVEFATKFVPTIVSVKAPPPGTVQLGEIVVIVGVALDPPDVGCLIDDGPVPPPHPARSKRLTIPPTASFLTSTASVFMAPFRSTYPLPHHRPSARSSRTQCRTRPFCDAKRFGNHGALLFLGLLLAFVYLAGISFFGPKNGCHGHNTFILTAGGFPRSLSGAKRGQ